MLKNNDFIRALLGQPVKQTPVWIMRQAGRYLPEYRQLRSQAQDFMQFCKTPELACEATLQPLRRFDLDAAILFSDILTIPEAMGMPLQFVTGTGPVFADPIRDQAALNQLVQPQMDKELSYVIEAVSLIHRELNYELPLIGFAGSPWTLACYMVEGQASKTFSQAKGMLYTNATLMHVLLQRLTTIIIDYLNAQIMAGADAVMLFDTWGGLLTTEHYQRFSLQYMQQIIDGLIHERERQRIPVILFTKGGASWLENMATSGCDAIGVDWSIDLSVARQRVGDQVALQGNLDPCVLYGQPDTIKQAVADLLADYGSGSGHVFNLGHGIYPDIDPDQVAVMVNAVHHYSRQYHISPSELANAH